MSRRTADLQAGSIDYLDEGAPDSPVALVLDGYGSRVLGELAAHVAQEVGVRVIAPDRPGYWNSASRDGDVLTAWPQACAELLDHLGLETAAVVGSSAACPLAFAAASELGTKISAVAIVGPMAPFGDASDLSDMHPAQARTFRLVQRRPAFGVVSMRLMGALARRWPTLMLRIVASQRPEVDAERMAEPEVRDLMLASIPGLLGQPAGHDLNALVGDWSALLDATTQPVRIFSGSVDSVHPPSMASALEGRLVNASVVQVDGGFFACTDRLDEVLRWAVTN